jgi:hypothetical protein
MINRVQRECFIVRLRQEAESSGFRPFVGNHRNWGLDADALLLYNVKAWMLLSRARRACSRLLCRTNWHPNVSTGRGRARGGRLPAQGSPD